MRMYELMSGQKRPLEFIFEDLKQRFKLKDKYSKVNDFKRWVLDIAKKELDESSPYSFNYIEVKGGTQGYRLQILPHIQPRQQGH